MSFNKDENGSVQNNENQNTQYTPPEQSPVNNNGEYHYVPPQNQNTQNQQSQNYTANNGGGQYQNQYTQPDFNQSNDFNNNSVKPKSKKSKTVWTIIIISIVCVAVAVFGIVYGVKNSNNNNETNTTASSGGASVQSSNDSPTKDENGNLTTVGVVKKVIGSCVGITVYSDQTQAGDFYNYFYSNGQNNNSSSPSKSGEGSGVLMYEDKDKGLTYILTCAHVISGGTKFTVTTSDGKEYNASLVGYDNQTDIGVLSISATGLNIAEFGNSEDIDIGEDCIAIGNPGGLEFSNSVTKGIVSGLNRPVESSIGYDNKCIQVDAAINPGNSGGALFNMQGQVIGINSSKIAATDYEGIGFAIPSNTAIDNANSIIKNGYVAGRAQIGIKYAPVSQFSNAKAIVSELEKEGYKNAEGAIVISSINEDSDLAGKDIKQYDIIVAVDDKVLTSTDILTSTLADKKPNDTVELTIARVENNKLKIFTVPCKLGESKGNQ